MPYAHTSEYSENFRAVSASGAVHFPEQVRLPLDKGLRHLVALAAALPQAPKIAPVKTAKSQRQLAQPSSKTLLGAASEMASGTAAKRGGGFSAVAAVATR